MDIPLRMPQDRTQAGERESKKGLFRLVHTTSTPLNLHQIAHHLKNNTHYLKPILIPHDLHVWEWN